MHYTLRLVVAGMIWAPFLGIFIGVLCAIFRGKFFDHFGMLFAITGLSAPGFWLGLMGIELFSVRLGLLPTTGLDTWKGYILPSLVMGTGIMAVLAVTPVPPCWRPCVRTMCVPPEPKVRRNSG